MISVNKVYFDLFGLLIKYLFFNNKFNKSILLSRVDFYYLLNIILKFNDIFIVSSYFLNFSNITVKDYRFFIISELILNFNCLYYFPFKLLNKIIFNNLSNINNLVLRVDSVLFFVLNVYIEYCRIFFFNNYVSRSLSKKYLNLKKHLINNKSTRYSLGKVFVSNLLFNKFLIYSNHYNYYYLSNKINYNQLDNILNQISKLNLLNLFDLKFLFFFINIFSKQIYLFILYYIYKS